MIAELLNCTAENFCGLRIRGEIFITDYFYHIFYPGSHTIRGYKIKNSREI